MPAIRNYKYSPGRHEPPVQVTGKVRGFLSGLFLGFIFAGAVHVYHVIQKPEVKDFSPPQSEPTAVKPPETAADAAAEAKPDIGSALHKALVKGANIEARKTSAQYILQAGSFSTKEGAETRRAAILELGYKSRMREVNTEDEILYLVELGPYREFETAQATLGALKKNRVEVLLKRYN